MWSLSSTEKGTKGVQVRVAWSQTIPAGQPIVGPQATPASWVSGMQRKRSSQLWSPGQALFTQTSA